MYYFAKNRIWKGSILYSIHNSFVSSSSSILSGWSITFYRIENLPSVNRFSPFLPCFSFYYSLETIAFIWTSTDHFWIGFQFTWQIGILVLLILRFQAYVAFQIFSWNEDSVVLRHATSLIWRQYPAYWMRYRPSNKAFRIAIGVKRDLLSE